MKIYQRLLASKPVFFKRVQRACLAFSLFCLGVLLWGGELPAVVQVGAACGYAAGVSAAVVCQFTTGGKTNKSKRNGKFISRHE